MLSFFCNPVLRLTHIPNDVSPAPLTCCRPAPLLQVPWLAQVEGRQGEGGAPQPADTSLLGTRASWGRAIREGGRDVREGQ